jgi:Ca-activated chloride channel homolog
MKKSFLLIVFLSLVLIINLAAKNYHYVSDFQKNDRDKILIIMDSSGSMSDEIDGRSKISIAKSTLNNVVSQLSPDINLGLRVYGHKMGFMGVDACRASELVVPIGPNNIQKIKTEANKLRPTGATPIIFSIQQALDQDFPMSDGGKKRIILLSDGMENCGGSPCEYAVDLVRKGIDLKIDVIGFDLDDETTIKQLKCVALSTKGKFYSANNGPELKNSLIDSLNITKEVQGKIYY